MNVFSIATQGKGFLPFIHRFRLIGRRYGLTAARMGQVLDEFVRFLQTNDCRATFPVTSVVLQRNPEIIQRLFRQGMEFAIHGYLHVDLSRLPVDTQREHLRRAIAIFAKHHIAFSGFRAPYLRWNTDTLRVIRDQSLLYEGSRALAWNVLSGAPNASYRRALKFYRAKPAERYPSLPCLNDGLICMPYTLPDDEALVERLNLSPVQMAEAWLCVLRQTHRLGELFVLGLHPERFWLCRTALATLLAQSRAMQPAVWIAPLGEIAGWWKARLQTVVSVRPLEGALKVTIKGPPGVTILARDVLPGGPSQAWDGNYRQVLASSFAVPGAVRPWIGVSARSAGALVSFLRQQGYIVEIAGEARDYTIYLDQPSFDPLQQRPLLRQIEESGVPLLRLGRWPRGARSALAITGDIDALTWWDYGARIIGR